MSKQEPIYSNLRLHEHIDQILKLLEYRIKESKDFEEVRFNGMVKTILEQLKERYWPYV